MFKVLLFLRSESHSATPYCFQTIPVNQPHSTAASGHAGLLLDSPPSPHCPSKPHSHLRSETCHMLFLTIYQPFQLHVVLSP